MDDFVLLAMALNLAYFVAAIVVAFFMLRWLDRRMGLEFKVVIGTITSEPLGAAVYFGCRLLAVAIIGAAFLG